MIQSPRRKSASFTRNSPTISHVTNHPVRNPWSYRTKLVDTLHVLCTKNDHVARFSPSLHESLNISGRVISTLPHAEAQTGSLYCQFLRCFRAGSKYTFPFFQLSNGSQNSRIFPALDTIPPSCIALPPTVPCIITYMAIMTYPRPPQTSVIIIRPSSTLVECPRRGP